MWDICETGNVLHRRLYDSIFESNLNMAFKVAAQERQQCLHYARVLSSLFYSSIIEVFSELFWSPGGPNPQETLTS